MEKIFQWDTSRKFKNTKEEKDISEKFKKNKKERMEETKRRDFDNVFSISISRECSWAIPPSCNPPSREPTRMGTSLTTCRVKPMLSMLCVE